MSGLATFGVRLPSFSELGSAMSVADENSLFSGEMPSN
jgi:hypothetical protein